MKICIAFLICLISVSSGATERSAALLCKKHIDRVEKDLDIPDGLLAAISIIESGRSSKHAPLHKVTKKKQPVAWPWVLNVGGKPEFFMSKTKAALALKAHLDHGKMNIDVGCAQINYRHHGHKFQSPSHMLDPRRNALYAGKFLRSLFEKHGSWTKAVGFYHSATLKHQVSYRQKVYRKWRNDRIDDRQDQKQNQNRDMLGTLVKSVNKSAKDFKKSPKGNPNAKFHDGPRIKIIRPKTSKVMFAMKKPPNPFPN